MDNCSTLAARKSRQTLTCRGALNAALPVLSHGLLYVNQNTRDRESGKAPRLVCYDFRK